MAKTLSEQAEHIADWVERAMPEEYHWITADLRAALLAEPGPNGKHELASAARNAAFCGQTQPHNPHTWAADGFGWYRNCSGHS